MAFECFLHSKMCFPWWPGKVKAHLQKPVSSMKQPFVCQAFILYHSSSNANIIMLHGFFFSQQFFHGRSNRSYTKFNNYGSCSCLLQIQICKSLSPNPSWNEHSCSCKADTQGTITQFSYLKETGQSFHKKSHVVPVSLPLLFGLWEPLEVPT